MTHTLSHAGWVLGAPLRVALLALIGLYRSTLGRLAGGRCRFHPTCSAYALTAIRGHGGVRGGALAIWRVLRCSPLSSGGIDPVPPPRPRHHRVTTSYAGDPPPRGEGQGRTASYRRKTA